MCVCGRERVGGRSREDGVSLKTKTKKFGRDNHKK